MARIQQPSDGPLIDTLAPPSVIREPDSVLIGDGGPLGRHIDLRRRLDPVEYRLKGADPR